MGLFWDIHTHIFTYLLTFPGPTRGRRRECRAPIEAPKAPRGKGMRKRYPLLTGVGSGEGADKFSISEVKKVSFGAFWVLLLQLN